MARPAKNVSFAVDAMLGSFARKLRILGFDTTYHKTGTDTELIALARRDGRVILTSDRQLHLRCTNNRTPALLIKGKSDRERLSHLIREAGANDIRLRSGESRCAVCNGALIRVKRSELAFHPELSRRHRLYFLCTDCGKVYWRGRHWTRLRKFLVLLSQKGFNQC